MPPAPEGTEGGYFETSAVWLPFVWNYPTLIMLMTLPWFVHPPPRKSLGRGRRVFLGATLVNSKDQLSCFAALLAGQNIFLNSWKSPFALPTPFSHQKRHFLQPLSFFRSQGAHISWLVYFITSNWKSVAQRFSPFQRGDGGIQR